MSKEPQGIWLDISVTPTGDVVLSATTPGDEYLGQVTLLAEELDKLQISSRQARSLSAGQQAPDRKGSIPGG